MARYYRGSNFNRMSEDGDKVKYVAMGDKYQEPETVEDTIGRHSGSWTFEDSGSWTFEGGYPVARIKLSYEQGEGTTPNFDKSAANHGGISLSHRDRTNSPPTELFHTDPDRLVVDSAFSHPDMSRHVPHLLAIAQMDNPHVKLSAAEDLSGYSSRLSRNAAKKGLVLPHPDNLDMSSDGEPIDANQDKYSRRTMVSDRVMDESTRIPEHAILNGKQFLRAALGRKPRTERMKAPDSAQLTLPGI